MSLPARAWIVGHGSRIVPRVPYEMAYRPDGISIVVAHHSEIGIRNLMIAPDPSAAGGPGAAPTSVALGPNTTAASDVLAFTEETRFSPEWSIVTQHYTCVWPKGTTLWSTPFEIGWAFELTVGDSSGDAMIYVQAPLPPAQSLTLDALIGDGMRAGAREKMEGAAGTGEWIELHYAVADAAWLQRRHIMPLGEEEFALVTSQGPEASAAAEFGVAAEVARTLVPRDPGED
jgi:hypothetical protein